MRNAMPVRTFIAVDLAESTLDALAEMPGKLSDPRANIRWVGRDNLHVTLQFLGDVADDLIASVCDRAAAAAAEVEPFDFEVRGVLCIPQAGQLRMVWASIHDTTGRMAALHDAAERELSSLGFEPEKRRFRPHLTLARIKHIRDPRGFRQAVEPYRDAAFGAQKAEELVVYSSQLKPEGPVYTPLARAPLGG